MKKLFLSLAVVTMALASCSTVSSTTNVQDVNNNLNSYSEVDLQVSDQKVTYTYEPVKKVRRGGLKNIQNTAVNEAIKANGGGDVLVSPNFQVTKRHGLFGSKIKKVVVTGYVGKYKNFRTVKPCCNK